MSPFIIATLALLLGLNLLIATLESAILARVLKLHWRTILPRITAANYFSTVVGGFILTILAESVGPRLLGPQPIFSLPRYLAFMLTLSPLISLVLKWLVARGALPKARSFPPFAAAHVASYLLIILPLYFFLSNYSLAGLQRAPITEVTSDSAATVYFLSPDTQTLHRIRLDGSPSEKVGDVGPHDPDQSELWLYPSEHGADLWLTKSRSTTPAANDRVLLKYVASDYPEFKPDHANKSVDLRPGPGAWEATTPPMGAYSPREGLTLRDPAAQQTRRLVIDTPFVSWNARSPSLLPGDRVLFQLGLQILLADPATGRLAFVATGHSPIVVPSHLAQQEKPQ